MVEEDAASGTFQGQRRLPYREKHIDSITQDDIKVCFVGMIIEKKGDTLIVDDGTGQVMVIVENAQPLGINKKIRVFGRVIPTEDGFEISGEIIQDFSDVDINIYKKAIKAGEGLGI